MPLHAPATSDVTGKIVEITEYEFVNDRDAAGNVRRVKKKVPPGPSLDPRTFNVFATEFDYDRAGEVQAIVQRTWIESSGVILAGTDQLVSIKEVRGQGRTRTMIRDWTFTWNAGTLAWNYVPDNASAVWTAYEGVSPLYDYTVTTGGAPTISTEYNLGLAQITGGQAECRSGVYA